MMMIMMMVGLMMVKVFELVLVKAFLTFNVQLIRTISLDKNLGSIQLDHNGFW
jgi:hypothetical protein